MTPATHNPAPQAGGHSRRHPLVHAVRSHSTGHYFWLFASLLLYMVIEPLLDFPMHIQVTSVLVFLAAVRTAREGILGRWGTMALAGVYATAATLAVITGTHWLVAAAGALFGALMLSVAIDGLAYVVGRSEIQADHIFAAICVYLAMSFLFAAAYWTIWVFDPSAFAGSGLSDDPHPREMGYFSFMILTTTGLGDILPISRLARLLATLEALCGTLYLALMIARLVGMYAQQVRDPDETGG